MVSGQISSRIKERIPNFKIGLITYNDITVSQTPKMFRGRFQMYQEELRLTLENKPVTDFIGVKEWRDTFKQLGVDPSRYRPSQEALLRRVKKGQALPEIHSAADVNNLASIQYKIPLGIYDLDQIKGNITVDINQEDQGYEAINGRYISMNEKLFTSDEQGAFGSPIVDSLRTMATENTINALQVVYIQPSATLEEASQLLKALAELFTFINGGEAEIALLN